MSSFLVRTSALRAILLGFLSLAVVAVLPTAARADAALDLVRSVAAEAAPCAPASTSKARKRRPPRAARARKFIRPARPARPHLTAAQRGSGRVDVLVLADDGPPASALPAVERKIDRVRPSGPRR